MSLVQKIFPNRSGYVLQVADLSVAGGAAQLRRAPLTAAGKRVLALVLMVGFVALTSVSGFFMATKTSPSASADWVSDIFCTSLENGDISSDENNSYASAGANNQIYAFGKSATIGASAWLSDGLLTVKSTDDSQKTAYEVFTPFLPVFDAWNGYYVDSTAGADTLQFHYPLKVSDGKPSQELPVVSYSGGSTNTLGQSYLFAHNVGADCMAGPAGKAFGTSVTNSLFMVPKLVTFFSAEIYGWAYQNAAISDKGSALHSLLYGDPGKNNGLNAIITGTSTSEGLKDVLYLPFLLPIVMLAALWILYNAIIRHRTNTATQGAIWLVAASITGLFFLSYPGLIPAASDKIVTTVDGATMNALNGTDNANKTQAGSFCALDGTQTTEKTVRELKCYMWYNTIYVPWLSGQFGTGEKISGGNNILTQNAGFTSVGTKDAHTAAANNLILDKTTIKLGSTTLANPSKDAGNVNANEGRWVVNWGSFELQQQARNWNGTKANQINALAFSQLSGNDGSTVNQTWGGDIMRQANAALLSAIAAIGTMILVLTSGFLLLGYQISMIFLIMLAPFFFLIGALPGLGKSIMMRWFELIASTVIKRIILTFVVALFLRLYSLIMGLNIAWWLQVVLMIIIAVVAMSQRANIVNSFAKTIDFGGNKNIGDGTEGVKTFGKRLAAGAALAGMGALGAKGGFGGVGGTGSKLKTAAGAIGNLAGKGGKGGGAAGAAGALGGGDGDDPTLNGGAAEGLDPQSPDINGVPVGETRPETDAPTIVTQELPPFVAGQEYKAKIVTVGEPKPTISVSNLPAGLSVSGDGEITGTVQKEAASSTTPVTEIQIEVKAENVHGAANATIKAQLFNAMGAGAKEAMGKYTAAQAQFGTDASRASDLASQATYERARLAAEESGKPDRVKAKHSPEAYKARMASKIGNPPKPENYTAARYHGSQEEADTALANDRVAYQQKVEAYQTENPYIDFAGDSVLRERRKAEITGQIDPMDAARLAARNKAVRTAALGGFERGFVENKDGKLSLDRGALYRQYRDGYILGDVKSTNTEIKLDAKQDRIEAAETRGLLARQIELQEESLRLQGGGSSLPPLGGGDAPLPPLGGGSGPAPITPPTTDSPVVTVGDRNPVVSSGPAQSDGLTIEQRRDQILRGRQENAQERARMTGGTPQKITAPPKPSRRVTVDPQKPAGQITRSAPTVPSSSKVVNPPSTNFHVGNIELTDQSWDRIQKAADELGVQISTESVGKNDLGIKADQVELTGDRDVVAQLSNQIAKATGDINNALPFNADRTPRAEAKRIKRVDDSHRDNDVFLREIPAKDLQPLPPSQFPQQQQAIGLPAPAPKKADASPAPKQQQQQQQLRTTPTPAPAPKKAAPASAPQKQQQTQQQLRTTSAPAPAPKKPAPAPAPKQAQQPQQQQQQVQSAPAPAPKKPPVKLPPIKVTINNNDSQQAQPAPAPTPNNNSFLQNKQYIEDRMARVQKQYLDDIPYRNGYGAPIRVIENWRRLYEPFNNEIEVFRRQAEAYNRTVPPEQQIDLDQYRPIEEP